MHDLTPIGRRKLYFLATDPGTVGVELWVTDGTAKGTAMLADIRTGASGSSPSSIIPLGSLTVFKADDGINGSELWVTDGTTKGTRLLKDIQTGEFAKRFVLENQAGNLGMHARRRAAAEHQLEEVGTRLRGLMPWIKKRSTKGAQAAYS